MAPRREIFPTKDAEFNTYIIIAILYLQANKARLGVTDAHMAELVALLGAIDTEGTWLYLFPRSQSNATKTPLITKDKTKTRKQLETAMRNSFKDIPVNDLTSTDRATLNLKERDTEPTDRPKITTSPFVKAKPLAGARMKLTARVDDDGNRASMHPDADGLEVCYIMGDTEPTTPSECTKTVVYSQAIHTLKLGIANAGKSFYFFIRWVNTSNAANNGPWAAVHHRRITD